MDRHIEIAVVNHLIGSMVHVVGHLECIRHNNPFTTSGKQERQWMVLLKNVLVSGFVVDHMWLHGCKRLNPLKKAHYGAVISLNGIIKPYTYDGITKWTLMFPYRNVEIHYENVI